MRGTVFVLSFAATCFSAQASSFIMPAPEPSATPSIIVLGAPEPVLPQPVASAGPSLDPVLPAAPTDAVAHTAALPQIETPSIIALGEPEPGISYDKVAAIPRPFSPMVIRGGIVGGLFADPTPVASPPAQAQANAAPDQAVAETESTASASQSQQASSSGPARTPR